MVNRQELKERLKNQLNSRKLSRQSVEAKINKKEKEEKKKDTSVYDNETSKDRKNRRKNNKKEVKNSYYANSNMENNPYGKQELTLTPEQQQEFLNQMLKEQQEKEMAEKMKLNEKEEQELKELNELIDFKTDLKDKNADWLVNHDKSDRIVKILNNIKNSENYQKFSEQSNNIPVVNDIEQKTDVSNTNIHQSIDIEDDINKESTITKRDIESINVVNDLEDNDIDNMNENISVVNDTVVNNIDTTS